MKYRILSTSLLTLLAYLLILLPGISLAQEGRVVESDSHRFVEVAEGVWFATGSGSVYTMSNAMA